MSKPGWESGFGKVSDRLALTWRAGAVRMTIWKGDGKWRCIHNLPGGTDIITLKAKTRLEAKKEARRVLQHEARRILDLVSP